MSGYYFILLLPLSFSGNATVLVVLVSDTSSTPALPDPADEGRGGKRAAA